MNNKIDSNKIYWKKVNNILEKHILKNKKGINVNILKLKPNQQIPFHEHFDTKYNYILEGSVYDEHGKYSSGTLIINKKWSKHSLKAGSKGCSFLVIWNR